MFKGSWHFADLHLTLDPHIIGGILTLKTLFNFTYLNI